MPKISTGYKLEKGIHAALVQASIRTGISQTRIVEDALKRYLKKCLTSTAVRATLTTTEPETAPPSSGEHNKESLDDHQC